jgi:hypothetical protein
MTLLDLSFALLSGAGRIPRTESPEWHRKNPPAECLSVTPERAEAKHRESQKVHEESKVRLEGFLRTGEDTGMPFS